VVAGEGLGREAARWRRCGGCEDMVAEQMMLSAGCNEQNAVAGWGCDIISNTNDSHAIAKSVVVLRHGAWAAVLTCVTWLPWCAATITIDRIVTINVDCR